MFLLRICLTLYRIVICKNSTLYYKHRNPKNEVRLPAIYVTKILKVSNLVYNNHAELYQIVKMIKVY